ncbi:MAG: UPF0182 family protein [Armatimonadetes bacterium]|nr:MAG: UPF0182 family protein [Armatimonadota bacterium]
MGRVPPREEGIPRPLVTLLKLVGLAVLVLGLSGVLASRLVEFWWYSEDVGATVLFWRPYQVGPGLFLIGFLVAGLAVYLSGRAALNTPAVQRVLSEPMPDSPLSVYLVRGHAWFMKALMWVAIFFGLVFGAGAASKWSQWLLYRNGEPFGRTDPIFGLDYSFYVFRLPFLQWVVSVAIGLIVICAILLLVIHVGVAGLAVVARIHLRDPAPRKHLTIAGAVFLIFLGIQTYLSRYEAVTAVGPRITGASYADLQAVGAQAIAAWLFVLAGIGALVTIRRNYTGLAIGAAVSVLFYVGGVMIWPGAVQAYKVQPNELQLETPYIQYAIDATRWAYGLDKIHVRENFPATVRPTKEEIDKSEQTLRNMRLWDPYILRSSVQQLQGLRDYYRFNDIDVDRYHVDGHQRMLMLGARDLVIDSSDTQRSNWQSLRLIYTHGNGVVACPVNEAGPSGKPVFFLKDIPPSGKPELAIEQPRIYFSDTTDYSGGPVDRYVIVKTKQEEFDRPSMAGKEDVFHRWAGDRGIRVGSGFRKFMASLFFGEYDILLSDALTDESILLFRRNVHTRAEKLFPFAYWDGDPYIAIVNKRLVWILDGYTVTNQIPYSARTGGVGGINYIRNSIKLTVDAYTGEWTAYRMDDEDPVLKTWEKIYPGLLTPAAEAPPELTAHFRYPEDLFTIQAHQLSLYHVTDPQVFFQRNDAWEIPTVGAGVGRDGSSFGQSATQRMVPYYVQMQLPEEDKDSFMLILPFTPLNRPNMIGWLAAHCDPEEYGKMVLYVFPEDRSINGPAQQDAMFNQDAQLAQVITLLDQRGSELQHGNLLVVPIGGSVMYVKTFFLVASGGQRIPELKLVVLAFSDKIVFADTYPKALEMLMGSVQPGVAGPEQPQPSGQTAPPSGVLEGDLARRGLEILNQAKQALRNGDWAAYGDAMKKLEDLLQQAAGGSTAPTGESQPSSQPAR